MAYETMCAILVSEPFYLRPWEIERLTDWQIKNIYFHPRKDGSVDVKAHDKPVDYKKSFWESCEDKGMRPEEIQKRWDSFQPKGETSGVQASLCLY